LALPSFYETVRRRLQDCDQIVMEGVTRLVRWTVLLRLAGADAHHIRGRVSRVVPARDSGWNNPAFVPLAGQS
jgi:hypothetical protein